ncbi:uncharacterized protein MONBRDRAFT_37905 [Monosiga brevicollis MX1]|uniref:Uncharacterized protein n=1 Tax=Monosiga brevicollis TaxID=81824 RepID=A9V4I5_MONBE|nr:uncharacterized protein MONBRDRAFT_37905 [Monosiga brevicollis MX1]EDQ87717.1 predicted protein [Monosiga brevicollis MX1]|eukprot:XP_001747637.1 hypothetical protein [Monosiga brevicollis MX1]
MACSDTDTIELSLGAGNNRANGRIRSRTRQVSAKVHLWRGVRISVKHVIFHGQSGCGSHDWRAGVIFLFLQDAGRGLRPVFACTCITPIFAIDQIDAVEPARDLQVCVCVCVLNEREAASGWKPRPITSSVRDTDSTSISTSSNISGMEAQALVDAGGANKMARHGMTRPSMAVKPLNAGSCFGAQPQLGEARPGQLNNIYHLIYNSSSATEIRPAQQVQLDLSRMSEDALAEAW